MDEKQILEAKYKHALIQLGNCFDAVFTLSAQVETLTAKLAELERSRDANNQQEGDLE